MSGRALSPGWRWVKFGDVVRLVTERCDPATAGLERFVGLEHIQPNNLQIQSWGNVADGTTFTSRFRPGQVLFGKRRAYQRKVAVADFDGVCSGDIYILESSDPLRLLPDLVSFLCQTDRFFEHAIGTSAGSLSPRTNWTSLAGYEFALPPIEVQNRLLQQLSSLEGLINSLRQVVRASEDSVDAVAQWWATAGLKPLGSQGTVQPTELPPGWRLMSIRALCTGEGSGLTLGPFGSGLTVKDYGHLNQGTPVLFVADVRRYNLRHESKKFISVEKHRELQAHEALPGDVLVTEMGWPPGETCVVPAGWPPSIIKADIIRARLNLKNTLPEYMTLVLNSHWGQQQMVRISPGTTRPRMTLRDFERLVLAVPSVDEQQEAVAQVEQLRKADSSVRNRLFSTLSAKAAILAATWG